LATSGTLTFAPSVTSKTITVFVNGDIGVEPDEIFTVELTLPTNVVIFTGTGIGTILNDDVTLTPNVTTLSNPSGPGVLPGATVSDSVTVSGSGPVPTGT